MAKFHAKWHFWQVHPESDFRHYAILALPAAVCFNRQRS